MASASHRSTYSVDVNSLHTPKQQRRMTSPSSLSIPMVPAPVQSTRPPSPLRNGFTMNTSTGIEFGDDDDDDEDEDEHRDWQRSPSPASSVSQSLATFAQRVGHMVGNIAPRSPGSMPTDAELEAEAERERDRSRKEAERIISLEAMERKLVEDRVMELVGSTPLLPPPNRSQTLPSNPPSPASSQKESPSWWIAAKARLTPTKEKDLTPAQQVIHETKVRDKEKQRERKNSKGKEKEWPANTQTKFNDPAFINLSTPQHQIPRRPVPVSPSSPTPASQLPPNLTPSPMRSITSNSSPSSKDAALPIYATFDPQGALDVGSTLLTIAKRFEKLEKWTVGHVRALEERMSDVERWLVEKENEKEVSEPAGNLDEMREELSELQSRMGEMGREVAKIATAPANLASVPSRKSAEVSSAPQTTSSLVEHDSFSASTTPSKDVYIPPSARQSTSPPMRSSSKLGSRLPYPTGDYATPPNSSQIPQPTSPTPSQRDPISGLPESSTTTGVGLGISSVSSSYSNASLSSMSSIGLPVRSTSPTVYSSPITSPIMKMASRPLPSPSGVNTTSSRMSSVSPSPTPRNRKRYTVALGGPITAPAEEAEDEDTSNEETIGKKNAASFTKTLLQDDDVFSSAHSTPDPRARTQSSYGQITPSPSAIQPLNPQRIRARSFSREGSVGGGGGSVGSNFVDPLVLRRQQEVAKGVNGASLGKGKVPIGELVKFFDKGKA